MTDIDKLIAAVEGGQVGWNRLANVAEDAVPPKEAALVATAYSGSLDAAHRLHDALLPGWGWTLECADAAEVWPLGKLKLAIRSYSDGGTPARAWLLAILRALREKEKGQ